MKYTVVWAKNAEQRLTSIWLAAPDRQFITQAANAIDDLLETDPTNVGESRGDDGRVVFLGSLGATFRVHKEDRLVRVLSVWRVRSGRKNS